MNILQIDEKWAVRFDPKNNDGPTEWLRNGNTQCEFDENNAVVAMFYALKEANAALTQSRAETAAAYERAAREAQVESQSNNPYVSGLAVRISDRIRTLATPDQPSALAAIEATAEARGRRTGIATEKLERLVNWLKEDEDNVFLLPAGDVEKMRAILAAIPHGEKWCAPMESAHMGNALGLIRRTPPMTDPAPDLLPCPFCGGKPEFSLGKTGDGNDWHYLECADCEAMAPRVQYAAHNIAIKDALSSAWNTRADLHDETKSQLAKAVEALRNIAVVGFSSDPSVNGAIAKQTVIQARTVLAEIEKGGV